MSWQPIESAPQDVVVIARSAHGERVIAERDEHGGWWAEMALGGEAVVTDKLTEWMPLPPDPPK